MAATSRPSTKYQAPKGVAVATPDKTITVQALADAGGRKVLDFGTPILFQGNKIGDVYLGVLEEPLSRIARLILVMLAALAAVTTELHATSSGAVPVPPPSLELLHAAHEARKRRGAKSRRGRFIG